MKNLSSFLLRVFTAARHLFAAIFPRNSIAWLYSRLCKSAFLLGLLGLSVPALAEDFYYEQPYGAPETITPRLSDTITIDDYTIDRRDCGGVQAVGSGDLLPGFDASMCSLKSSVFGQQSTSGGHIEDYYGNIIVQWDSVGPDTTPVTVKSVSSNAADRRYKVGDVISIYVHLSERVEQVIGTPQLTLETGTTDRVASYLSLSNSGFLSSTLTFSYTVQAGDTSADLDYAGTTALSLNGGTILDWGGNPLDVTLPTPGSYDSLSYFSAFVIDGVVPTVTSVNSSSANGTYKLGDTISVQVNFSEAVTVTGTPRLTLETGTTDRTVNYASGNNTSALTFTYTVQAGDTAADLDYISTGALTLNGGTIKDSAGNNATLTLASPGATNSLGANKALVIDGVVPTVTSVNATGSDGSHRVGSVIFIQVNFSETITVTGTPQLTLETGATDQVVSYAFGSGSGALYFNYFVQAGDTAADLDYISTSALALNGGTVKDSAGNTATLTLPVPGAAGSLAANRAFVVDTTAPSVTSVTSSTANGSYRAGDTVSIQVNFDEPVIVTGAPQFSLETGSTDRTVNYVSGSGTSALTFTYTVQAGDTAADLDYISTNSLSGTINDFADNTATLTLPSPGAPNSLGANKALVIDTTPDTTPPTVSITMTDTELLVGQTSLVTFTFSEAVTGFTNNNLTTSNGTLTAVTSQDGGTIWTATFTPDANVISTFVDGIKLNMAGVVDAAGNAGAGTIAGPNYVVHTAAISAVITLDDTALSVGERTRVTIAFNMGVNRFNRDDVVVQNATFSDPTTEQGPDYGRVWTITLTPTDGVSDQDNTVRVALGAVEDWTGRTGPGDIESPNYTVDTVRPALASAITISDTLLAIGETATVTFTFTEAVTGFTTQDLTVEMRTYRGPSMGTITNLTTIDNGITWTATLTPSDMYALAFDDVVTLDLSGVTDLAGNAGFGTADSNGFDINAIRPSATIVVADNALSFGETSQVTFTFSEAVTEFTNADLTISNGTLSAVASLDDGTIWTATFTPNAALNAPSNVITLNLTGVVNAAGNAGNGSTDSNSFAIDTIDPNAPVADAGADQTVASQAIVTLNGAGGLTYLWSQTSGPSVVLSDATAQQPSFTAPSSTAGDVVLVFTLVVNDGASAPDTVTITVQASDATPETVFDEQAEVIGDTVTDNATGGLNSAISANQTMMQAAKGRFIAGGNQNVALDVDGSLNVDGLNLSTMGTFYGQSVIGAGARRLIFGSFDIQRDGDTSTTTFSGKMSWEKALSDKTMMGFFIGAEVARSNLQGSFTGGQDHLGLSLGGYAVQELASQIYLDGFVSLGAGRNNLSMSDGILDLDSNYATRSASFGASLSGVIAANGFEVLPELSLSIGRTWIDEMAFTGTAYGVIDNSLRINAGMVTLSSLTFRPQIRMALDGEATAKSKHVLTFAPRLICQEATTRTCGRGAEIGVQSQSDDGMTTAAIQIQSDLIDGRTSTTAQIKLEHRF